MDPDILNVMLIGAEDALAARVVGGLGARASVAIAPDSRSAEWATVELAIVVAKDESDCELILRSAADRPVLFVERETARSPESSRFVGSWDPDGEDAELVTIVVDLARRRAEHAIDPGTLAMLEEALGSEEVVELLDTYLQTSPPLLVTATGALRDRDSKLLFSQAHQLKASSAAVGLPAVARAAAALEAAARTATSEQAAPLLAELERQFRWACRALVARRG